MSGPKRRFKFFGRLILQAGMQARGVVGFEKLGKLSARLFQILVPLEVDLLTFDLLFHPLYMHFFHKLMNIMTCIHNKRSYILVAAKG